MTRNPPTSYEPQAMKDRRMSDEFHTLIFRDPETQAKETVMDDFLDFVQDEFEMSTEEMSDLQALVNAFVGYDIDKATRGEKALLERWNKSVLG